MKLIKKIQYKYLQNSYRPNKKNSIVSKATLNLIDDMEKYLDKKVANLFGDKESKESKESKKDNDE